MKVDRLMRASPLPALVLMLAKVLTALVFSLVALILLISYGILVGGIHHLDALGGEHLHNAVERLGRHVARVDGHRDVPDSHGTLLSCPRQQVCHGIAGWPRRGK